MAKDEKFIPIITPAVYCGTDHPWDGAKCLHDLLEMDEEKRETYSRIDSDTRELIEVVGKVRIGEEYEIMENEERRYDMCKKLMKNKPAVVIEEELEEKLEAVERIIKVQRQLGV